MSSSRYTRRTFGREIVLVLGAAVFCVPFYLLVTGSLKSIREVLLSPLSLPTSLQFENYSDAWAGTTTLGLGHAFVNTVIMTLGSVALLIGFGSLAAYVLARRQSRLSTGLYLFFVAGIIVPFQLGVIPIYVVMRDLGLVGTYQGMIILYTALLMPLTVFLYTGFIRALPREYEEAAQVDGATLMRTFFRVVFPLMRPVTATVALLTGIIIWNEFFVPLIFLTGSDKQPLNVAIYSFVGENLTQWNVIFAAVLISLAPIAAFYIFAQKGLIKGFAGGIRG